MLPASTNPIRFFTYALRWPASIMSEVVWIERKRVLIIALLCTALGMGITLLMTPEFRSEARLVPEMSNGDDDMLKRLASVAGFAGVDLGDAEGVDAVRPDLYPNVLQSTPFMMYLIEQPVTTSEGRVQTVGHFLMPQGRPGVMSRLFAWTRVGNPVYKSGLKSDGMVRLTGRQQDLLDDISERVSAKFDTRSGIITITSTMPDAQVAATVAQRSMQYLRNYVVNYRTEKARQDMNFYRQQLADAHKRFQKAQLTLFQYIDNHKHVVMMSTTMERQLLEAELSIAQTVYTELARQFEQAKLKVQARTPVFKVLEPPKVPLRRVSPKRTLLTLLSTLCGLVLGAFYVLIRQSIADLRPEEPTFVHTGTNRQTQLT